ncbi:helix-turn-helix domain-containing protein [Streptomyces incanus]|uniref:Helix-turn-helix domain-containing protein n=1 Tax=Streptomyces incanus TaxID=887453 RepID=A0ABW0XMI3_9ACTN
MVRRDLPPGAARLLRADGSVVIPASVAGDVLRRLARDLTAEIQANGGTPSPAVYATFWALYGAARADDEKGCELVRTPGGFPGETGVAGSASVEVSAGDWAERHGCSVQYARRLAKAGRVPARRVGREWLITEAEAAA